MSAERIARNDAVFRKANEEIREAAERLEVDMKVPFICECADPNCRTILRLTLDEYRAVRSDARHFINAPDHEAPHRDGERLSPVPTAMSPSVGG